MEFLKFWSFGDNWETVGKWLMVFGWLLICTFDGGVWTKLWMVFLRFSCLEVSPWGCFARSLLGLNLWFLLTMVGVLDGDWCSFRLEGDPEIESIERGNFIGDIFSPSSVTSWSNLGEDILTINHRVLRSKQEGAGIRRRRKETRECSNNKIGAEPFNFFSGDVYFSRNA